MGPAVDHRMDEQIIWNFNLNTVGLPVIQNEWITDPWRAIKKNYLPWWKDKMCAPNYITIDKINMYNKHWEWRRGLENLKKKHAYYDQQIDRPANYDKIMQKEMKEYVEKAYEELEAEQLKEVYVTDHVPKPQKYNTTSEEDDKEFFEIKKEFDEYNKDASGPVRTPKPIGRSILDVFEPSKFQKQNSEGVYFQKLEDRDLLNKDELKEKYEKLVQSSSEVQEVAEAEEIDLEEDNSVFEGFKLDDKYFIELYKTKNPEFSEYLKSL